MGLFFYNKIGSIISIGDLPTTNIIEPKKKAQPSFFVVEIKGCLILIVFIKQNTIYKKMNKIKQKPLTTISYSVILIA